MKTYYLLALMMFLADCATAQKLTPGNYLETPEKGILWVEHTLTFHDDHTFSYNRWSDDLAANEYGAGTYQIRQQVLTLSFEKQVPQRPPQAQTYPLASKPDSLVFTFRVTSNSRSKAGAEPTIKALDASGNTVASTYTNEQGQGIFRFARVAQPQVLQVSFLGCLPYSQPCPASSTAFQVVLEPKHGTPVQAGTIKEYPIVNLADGQLTVWWDKRRTNFVLQP
ncbi:MAG: carboxypeptidase regulatory-like domain-containing protein [Hymenobacter sp.]|nr:MAG: carboxypeptidase regulatory-like domain-containing protein [Hymenobacter sp.]